MVVSLGLEGRFRQVLTHVCSAKVQPDRWLAVVNRCS